MRTLALALAFAVLAGCTSSPPDAPIDPEVLPELSVGKGAITGLLIDDVYRPVPGGLVFLEGTGLTATTDASGLFRFVDLPPASYVAIANAPGHEAAPANVDVEAGAYAELEIQARRIFSDEGSVITTQYSVFI